MQYIFTLTNYLYLILRHKSLTEDKNHTLRMYKKVTKSEMSRKCAPFDATEIQNLTSAQLSGNLN